MRAIRYAAACVVSLGLVAVGGAVAGAVSVSVPIYTQEKSQWCWAASSKMVIATVAKKYPTQRDVVKKGFNSSNCDNKPGEFGDDIKRALEAYGVKNGSVQSSAATAAKTRSELEAGRPVMVRYGYKSDQKKTGHVVTVKGYAYNSKTKVNDYSWQDPYTGTTKTGTYSYLLDNSTWAWTHTRTGLVKK